MENNKISNNEKLFTLYKVIGLGTKDNFSITTSAKNGLTAWIAGPHVILYDIKRDKQIYFLSNKNNKIFNCVSFSEEGSLLACGEGNCKNSEIIFYEINLDQFNGNVKYSLKAHKFGIDKLKFYKNDRYIISIGDREDKTIHITDLTTQEIMLNTKFNRSILCFDVCDNFLVFGGNQFLKIWSIYDQDKFIVKRDNVEIGKLRDKVFTSAVIYSNFSSPDKRVLFLTSDGHLAEMKSTTKQLSRWVHLRTDKGISLCMYDNLLLCGCSDGIIRIFKVDTLEHFATLHRPPPLGRANIDSSIKKINISVTQDEKFADVVTLCYNKYYERLISIYSDKTFFVWDLKKNDKIYVDRYNAFHSGSINFMDVQITADNFLRIASCSDDKTVKFWNFKLEDFGIQINSDNNAVGRKLSHIAYSKYIRRIFYFGQNFNHFKFNMEDFINGENGKIKDLNYDDYDDSEITSLKFSPDEKYLACGSVAGNLYIYNLTTFEQSNFATAHNAKISCIDFIKTTTGQYLLATGSYDNLINVIDVSIGIEKDFESFERSVLFDHQEPITDILFCIDKMQKTKLISCSSDRSINFYLVHSATSIQLIQKFQEPDVRTYCLAFNPGKNQIIAGHNGKVTMWKTKMCIVDKIFKMKRGENLLDSFRIAVDITGSIFAISNNDKYIRIRSTFDGQLITKIPIAESISSLCFSINNNFLIASSVEGYIYFFKMDLDNIPIKPPQPSLKKVKINNKLKILEKFMQEDVNFSKNEIVKALVEKMKNSEDIRYEDLKKLDSYFIDKKMLKKSNTNKIEDKVDEQIKISDNNIENSDILPNPIKTAISEIIELKEEKASNEEDEENKNNRNEISNEKLEYFNRSTIFEKNLKEISSDVLKKSILSHSRVSLADTYYKKKTTTDNNKNELMHIPKSKVIESIFKVAKVDLSLNKEEIDKRDKINEEKNQIKKPELISKNDTNKNKINSKEEIIQANLESEKINKPEATTVYNSTNDILSKNNLNNDQIKLNNFMGQVNKISKDKDNINTNNGEDLTRLQNLISEANKFVDSVENKVNKSSELNKNKIEKNEDYDYFSNYDQISNINAADTKYGTKEHNIFMKNYHETKEISKINTNETDKHDINISKETQKENNKEVININKFNNIKIYEENKNKNNLEEIAEDLQLEDLSETNNQRLESRTFNCDISDTIVNREKIQLGEININNTFMQSHFNNDVTQTQLLSTELFNENNVHTLRQNQSNLTTLLNNSTITELVSVPIKLTNENKNIKSKDACVPENFRFSLEVSSISNKQTANMSDANSLNSYVKNFENAIDFNKVKNSSHELINLLQSLTRLSGKLEAILVESGSIEKNKNNLEITSSELLLEKYVEKYSQLLLSKIDEKLKKC